MGLKMLKSMQEADKAKLFPDLMITRQAEMDAHAGRVCPTFKSHLFGQEMMMTSDPKNIQVSHLGKRRGRSRTGPEQTGYRAAG